MNGKALRCRELTPAAYLDGIFGALFPEFVRRPLSGTFQPFPVAVQAALHVELVGLLLPGEFIQSLIWPEPVDAKGE
jgi:hypothetical protein